MRKMLFIISLLSMILSISSCEYDNYDEPQETLRGSIIDKNTGKPIQTEAGTGSIRIKLLEYSWSDTPTPYYVQCMQDGTFNNTKIFKGNYNIEPEGPFVPLILKDGSGNIIKDETKTLDIKGTISLDFPVEPFLNIEWVGEPVISDNGKITVQVKVARGTDHPDYQQSVTDINLYVSNNAYVGENNFVKSYTTKVSYSGSDGNNLLGQTITITSAGTLIPNADYYLRVGARTSTKIAGSSRYNYTTVEHVKSPSQLFTDFTTADADKAIEAFHETFFDKSKKIYYANSGKSGIAAIWTQAIYWDMAMNAFNRTKNPQHKQMVDDIYAGNKNHYDTFNWDNGKVWFIYDDIMWWVISLARGYEQYGTKEYLDYAESGFKRVWEGSPVVGDPGSYDPVKGGMYWQWIQSNPPNRPADDGKMACINYPTVIAAMTLHNATGKADYLDKAKEIYDWAYNNLFDKSLGRVADSKHGDGNPAWKDHLYNQGTCIGAAMILYKKTGEQRYLQDAVLAADYVKNTMGSDGMLPFENGIEKGIYGAIFSQYIIRLIEDGNKPQYLDWLRQNINSAWNNRDVSRNITYKDATVPCSTGIVEVYDASTCPALMQVISPKSK